MSDHDPVPELLPDDELVSAVLDGEASSAESARVAADPRLAARLARFGEVAAAVASPSPPADPGLKSAHLARALDAARVAAPGPTDLTAARAERRGPRRALAALSIAAAVVLIAAAGTLLVRVLDSGTATDAEIAADGGTASEGADAAPAVTSTVPAASPGASTEASGLAAEAAVPDSSAEAQVPDLGAVASAEELLRGVRTALARDPDVGRRTGPTDDPCGEAFTVPVLLVGRASFAGEAGLVYVEATPSSAAGTESRRVWLVRPGAEADGPLGGDSDTEAAGDVSCRDLLAVQRL